jgi:hypothetical protein
MRTSGRGRMQFAELLNHPGGTGMMALGHFIGDGPSGINTQFAMD